MNLRFDIVSLLSAFSMSAGIMLCLHLVLFSRENRVANILFSLFILFNCQIVFMFGISLLTGLYIFIPHSVRISFLMQLLLPPSVYLYVKILSDRQFKLTWKSLLHLVPLCVFLILNYRFYFSPAAVKLESVREWIFTETHDNKNMLIKYLLQVPFLVQFISYQPFIISLLWKFRRPKSDFRSDIDKKRFRWLVSLVAGWAGLTALLILLYLFFVLRIISMIFYCRFLAAGISGLMSYYVVRAFLMPEMSPVMSAVRVKPDGKAAKREYRKPSPENLDRMHGELLQLMDRLSLYKDPDLTLPKLAEIMKIPRGTLSCIINERTGGNFFDFINSYRMEEARKLLFLMPDLNILDIALDSGFNSKTTFYKIFKAKYGISPKAYRKTRKIDDNLICL